MVIIEVQGGEEIKVKIPLRANETRAAFQPSKGLNIRNGWLAVVQLRSTRKQLVMENLALEWKVEEGDMAYAYLVMTCITLCLFTIFFPHLDLNFT